MLVVLGLRNLNLEILLLHAFYIRTPVPSETMEEKSEHILLSHFEPVWTWARHLVSHSWSCSEALSSF